MSNINWTDFLGVPIRSEENWVEFVDNPTLALVYPYLVDVWHPTKNKRKPDMIRYDSKAPRVIWLFCEEGHVWCTTLAKVTSDYTGLVCQECVRSIGTVKQPEGFHVAISPLEDKAEIHYPEKAEAINIVGTGPVINCENREKENRYNLYLELKSEFEEQHE